MTRSDQSADNSLFLRVMQAVKSNSKSRFVIISNIAVTNSTSDCSIREC